MPRTGQLAQVLLVESEPAVAESLARVLGHAGFATTTVASAAAALAAADRAPPDLVLVDLVLPDANAHDVCDRLRRRSGTPVVMLAATIADADRAAALDRADDYIVRSMRAGEVVGRLRAVLRRTRRAAQVAPLVQVGPLELDGGSRRARLDGRTLPLTRKEFDLLARLVRDAGRVVPRTTLLRDVWGAKRAASTRTLDVHVGWLRRKLGEDPAHRRFIHTVRGVGFRFASERELTS